MTAHFTDAVRPFHEIVSSHSLAFAGKTVSSRVSHRLRPLAWVVAKPLGLRRAAPSSSLSRSFG